VTPATRLTRHDTITEAITVISNIQGDGPTLRAVLAALKAMQIKTSIRRLDPPFDYAGQAQAEARARRGKATIETPLGTLRHTAIIVPWSSSGGTRTAWRGIWTLDGEDVTYAYLRAVGLVKKRKRATKAEMAARDMVI